MRFGINCGHTKSGVGCGAIGYLNESDEVRNVGYILMEYLRAAGHTVVDCTNDKASSVSANLKNIVNIANAQPLDLFVSIHFNAGKGRGVETYTCTGNADNYPEAGKVCDNLERLGFVNRGVKKGSHLYVVKNTNSKAMLIEVCFVDTKSDADVYKKVGADAVAKEIYKAITGENLAEKEDLSMTQYEELKKENQALKDEISTLKGNQEKVYHYTTEIPDWGRPTIQKLLDKGLLKGESESDLNLPESLVRTLVINDRAGLYE